MPSVSMLASIRIGVTLALRQPAREASLMQAYRDLIADMRRRNGGRAVFEGSPASAVMPARSAVMRMIAPRIDLCNAAHHRDVARDCPPKGCGFRGAGKVNGLAPLAGSPGDSGTRCCRQDARLPVAGSVTVRHNVSACRTKAATKLRGRL